MYSNADGEFTVLIRELNPQDSAVYRFGAGNENYKDTELTVQKDSCCGGVEKMNAHLGETATFKRNYPEFKTNYKYLLTLNKQKTVMYTGKESQKEQKGRFSIFDDRSSKVFSVNISDVTEGDGGVYLCGVWRKETSVGYYFYFREIQLQVTGSASSPKTKPKDDKQVLHVVCTYEEIKHNRPASPLNTSHTDIHSTEDHSLTYSTASFTAESRGKDLELAQDVFEVETERATPVFDSEPEAQEPYYNRGP
ncbi:hypothetical protein AOLI_G00234130 [Acnodon oligacanthus]